MTQAAVIVSMAALVIVSMNLSLAIILAKKNQDKWAQWNIVLASTLLGMAVFYTLKIVAGHLFTGVPLLVLNYVFDAFYIIDTSFLVVFICRFATWLVARPMSKLEIVITFIVGVCYCASAVITTIIDVPLLKTLQSLIPVINVVYCFVVMLISRNSIENKLVKHAVFTFTIISLSTIPLLVLSALFTSFRSLSFCVIELAYYIMHLVFMFLAIEKAEEDSRKKTRTGEPKCEDYAEFRITEREFEVIKLIKKGMTNKEIGYELKISVNTVNNHIANIFQKTGVKSRIDLLNVLHEATW
jgi:DNA-binding CsgD family transcriptional regulator